MVVPKCLEAVRLRFVDTGHVVQVSDIVAETPTSPTRTTHPEGHARLRPTRPGAWRPLPVCLVWPPFRWSERLDRCPWIFVDVLVQGVQYNRSHKGRNTQCRNESKESHPNIPFTGPYPEISLHHRPSDSGEIPKWNKGLLEYFILLWLEPL